MFFSPNVPFVRNQVSIYEWTIYPASPPPPPLQVFDLQTNVLLSKYLIFPMKGFPSFPHTCVPFFGFTDNSQFQICIIHTPCPEWWCFPTTPILPFPIRLSKPCLAPNDGAKMRVFDCCAKWLIVIAPVAAPTACRVMSSRRRQFVSRQVVILSPKKVAEGKNFVVDARASISGSQY